MLRIIKKALNAYLRRYSTNRLRDIIVNGHNDISVVREGVFDARKYGFSLTESQQLCLTKENYKDYITTWEAYQPRMKQTPYFVMSDDKYIFSMTFGKYIEVPKSYALIQNGKVVSLDETLGNKNVYDFLVAKNGGVIKDRGGCDGFDVYVFKVIDNKLTYKGKEVSRDEMETIIQKFPNGIIQNNIIQGKFENEIFDKSVNTIRVVSMKRKDDDCHEVVAALQRIGTNRSAPVDNFNQGGGSAIISVETGEIGSMTCIDSFDGDGKRLFYDVHPDSGAQIKGKVVPCWNEIKEKIEDVTRKLPYFEYIAWDIVVKDDGLALIETNMKSSLNVFQVHGGMRESYLGQKYREHGYIKE